MHAARAAGLRPAGQPELLEERLHRQGNVADIRPGHAGRRIEIDAEPVGMIEVTGADRMGMQLDAAEIDDVSEAGGIVVHHLLGGAARGKGERDGA